MNLKNIYENLNPEKIKEIIISELKNFVYPIDLNNIYDKHEIFEFCSELKQFYVIITRAKTFLVFYEGNLNRERSGFYEFMKSKDINLIETEDNKEITQKKFLEEVSEYFDKINLTVKSPIELRILGNDEFNEGHYSRANYLYKVGNHKSLILISDIFYNEELLNEEINVHNKKNLELKELNLKIVKDITSIIKELEEGNIEEVLGNEKNRINFDKSNEGRNKR